MKKIIFCLFICLAVCSGCDKKAELIVPDPIEPTIDEIKKSNLEVAKTSFKNIKNMAQVYYLELQLDEFYVPADVVIDFSNESTIPKDFVFDGETPTKGIVMIDTEGNVTLTNIVINNLTCNYDQNNEIICI